MMFMENLKQYFRVGKPNLETNILRQHAV